LRTVTTPVASQLTGLSTEKLREWTSRRALISVDVRPKCKGSPAQFSWQTILVLRIAFLLRDNFHLELQAHKRSFARLRKELKTRSFIALWGQQLALSAAGNWSIVDSRDALPGKDVLLIRLDSHLEVLREGFALPDASGGAGQFDLFSLPNVHGGQRRQRVGPTMAAKVRRSA
jgi:hypothetical protein